MRATAGVARGCGRRVEAGVYLECGVGPHGRPLEWFLADPPVPMEMSKKLGVEVVRTWDGRVHLLDWVGESHYPFASDVLEEGRRFGFSRRVPRSLDLSSLTATSRLLLVHAKGLVANQKELRAFMDPHYDTPYRAGRLKPAHEHHCGHLERTGSTQHYESGEHACTRYLWAVRPATEVHAHLPGSLSTRPVGDRGLAPGESAVYACRHASIRYRVYPLSPDAPEPVFASALIASLPITNVSVVKARDGSHAGTLREVRRMLEGKGGGLKIAVSESDA